MSALRGTAKNGSDISAGGFGIRNRLMAFFVFFAVSPVLFFGILAYNTVNQFVTSNLRKDMAMLVTLRTKNLEHYFNAIVSDIQNQSENTSNRFFLESLHRLQDQSGLSPVDFIRQTDWKKFSRETREFEHSLDSGKYSDAFLVDQHGNILFAIESKDMMGFNLYSGHRKNLKLSDACRAAVESDKAVFSDYEMTEKQGKEMAFGYMACPVHVNGKQSIGLIVYQFRIDTLNHMLREHMVLGQSYENYLVGDDGYLRTDSGKRHEKKALSTKVETEAIQNGVVTIQMNDNETDMPPLQAYAGPDNIPMIGIHAPIVIGKIRYEIVAEMEQMEAFALIEKIRMMLIMFMSAAVILAGLASYFIADFIARPLRVMTGWAGNVATGDLSIIDIHTADDEIGRFHHNFRQLIYYLKDIARFAVSISAGDYTEIIEPRSAYDELGAALKRTNEALQHASRAMAAVADGDLNVSIPVKGPNDLLACSVNTMVDKIRKAKDDNDQQDSAKALNEELNRIMRGDPDLQDLTCHILTFLCSLFNAAVGVFYIHDQDGDCIRLSGSYALPAANGIPEIIQNDEGVIGQVFKERKKIIIDHCPDGYLKAASNVSNLSVRTILVFPFIREGKIEGIVEMGTPDHFNAGHIEFLEHVSESIGIALTASKSRQKMTSLLEKTVRQANDLRIKQDELNQANRELKETETRLRKQENELMKTNKDLFRQAVNLRRSERRLKAKQEQLLITNETLRIRSIHLEKQKDDIHDKNIQLEKIKNDLIEKTEKIVNSSRNKSEFLASMSHEFRTPLNSILLISRLMNENKTGTLSPKEVEFARTIHLAGMDLLSLIDDILDLSKLEAGKFEIIVDQARISDLKDRIILNFRDICKEKGIDLITEIKPDVPETVFIDLKRMDQVIKNLVSNAVKFTEDGFVRMEISIPVSLPESLSGPNEPKEALKITVHDTGTGIPADKREVVFQAFHQVDGSISRQYGGTGLGLSISKELVRLMGGDIVLYSTEGMGSTFEVFIPQALIQPQYNNPDFNLIRNLTVNVSEEHPVHGIQSVAFDLKKTGIDDIIKTDSDVFSGKQILIADNDMRNVYSLISAIGDDNAEIFVGKTQEECLEILDHHPAMDLIVMDCMNIEMSGIRMVEILRGRKQFENLPVIMLITESQVTDIPVPGPSQYLIKPIDTHRLLSVMKDMVNIGLNRQP